MIGVWQWLESIFAISGAPSGPINISTKEDDRITVAKLAVDPAARNALLEIRFANQKARPRRFALAANTPPRARSR